MVVTTGSVKLTDDQTYELWRIDGANASPVGVFRPDADGNVRTSFQADLNGADVGRDGRTGGRIRHPDAAGGAQRRRTGLTLLIRLSNREANHGRGWRR